MHRRLIPAVAGVAILLAKGWVGWGAVIVGAAAGAGGITR